MRCAAVRSPDAGRLHAGVARAQRILDGLDAVAAREFRRVTRAVMGDGGALAWPDGLLNESDCPLEFSFGPAAHGLRYTMELGMPDAAAAGRLALVGATLASLDAPPPAGGVMEAFAALQRARPLAWGAWLAARQEAPAAGAVQTRYKVYAEIPDGGHDALDTLMARYLGAPALPAGTFARPVMAGAAPGSDRCEFYFELGRRTLGLAELRGLLGHVGLAPLCGALAAQVAGFEFRQGRQPDALPRAHYGLSYSVLPGRADPVCSLHVFGHDLSGGDAGIRHQALAAAWQGTGLPVYEALTAPLAGHDAHAHHHNMLTFSVGDGVAPAWLLSVSPPPDPMSHS